jgi:polyketide biosynthesis acyl carrier protein
MEQSLKDDLGANSIDRMDIIVQSMNDLKVKIPMIEFGRLKNIEGIVEVLFANLSNTGA